MTALTVHTSQTTPDDDPNYQAGLLDGELDAIGKLPAATAMARASMADPYDPAWAQGYADGFQNGIEAVAALRQVIDRVPER
ncbi:hypothetical protein [Streptomyces sp. NPDC001492]